MVGKLVGGMKRVWLRLILAVALVLCGIVVTHWPDIEFELGYAYESGHFHGMPGFAKDPQQAVLWLERAARVGHPRAQYRLGILLAHGWGAPRRNDLANAWLNASARNDYAPASYHLGWMYHNHKNQNFKLCLLNTLRRGISNAHCSAPAQLALPFLFGRRPRATHIHVRTGDGECKF
jgi:TPR repeat protein